MGRGRLVVLLLVGAVVGAAACSSANSSPPLGHGDTVTVDVEASTLPPQTSSDADQDPDGIFDKVDSSSIYGTASYDGYAPVTVCDPPDGSAGPAGSDGGDVMTDAAAAAVYADGGAAATGCAPFPAACASTDPVCQCLIGAFKAQTPCAYPSCAPQKHGFAIYCPP
jgi:hypothetical protein